jgi:low temperature requirement protein LtrA
MSSKTLPSLVSPDDQRVTFVELFFDLVFVFSVTQVVGFLHEGLTLDRAAEAVLIFWLIWWAWVQFTWALNAANTDHPHVELMTLLATAVAFFLAVAVPFAFEDGALWFAVPYVLVRTIGLVVYVWVAVDEAHGAAVRLFATGSAAGFAAVLVGAYLGGAAQHWLWALAIGLDVLAASVAGRQAAWNLHPAHFVERYGLIVIIALGESLIVAAAGLTATPDDLDVVAVAILAVALACAIWWSYFPYLRVELEHAMARASGAEQSTMARDAFSLAHFPMLCGIIGVAIAIEEGLLHPAEPVPLPGRLALGGGLLLFLGGSALSTLRAVGKLPMLRLLVAITAAGVIVGLGAARPWLGLSIGLAGTVVIISGERR